MPKQSNNIIVKLEDEIYGGNISVIIGDWSYFCDYVNKRYKGMAELPYAKVSEEAKHLGGYHGSLFCLKDGFHPTSDNYIFVNGNHDKATVISCLAHELLHADLLLMEMIGVDCSKEGNQETVAYWHTWAMRKCLNAMKIV
jgi:hypothetical protein